MHVQKLLDDDSNNNIYVANDKQEINHAIFD